MVFVNASHLPSRTSRPASQNLAAACVCPTAHPTDKEKILKTYKGTIATTKSYRSERLITNMKQPTHHILSTNPTTYRNTWHFYLVFYSPKFNNVYFKKGEWVELP
ncbi:MAG: hypothetical protein R2798_08500 [Chitinophagales bacterium]|nr:hypothetical protein [Bacteroidota bacterium]MCB9042469.1 hypothetical protein [Chitinophagales bacterium]